tara:strand:+ start:43982 stop:51490 length:7509 start_codon:yes stop_codon:yes gene_type:complete
MKTRPAQKQTAKFGRLMISSALTAATLVAYAGQATADAGPWTEWDSQNNFTLNSDGTNTTINTSAIRAGGNSPDLNIDLNESVRVNQISSDALFYGRAADDADPTKILGALSSNGRLLIIDRNGVFFGAGSHVDTAGIVVTTGDISDDQIMNNDFGQYTILNMNGTGSIDLNGQMTISEAGLAGFVAPTVKNNGVINAKLAKIAFASGDAVTLDLYGDSLVEIEVAGSDADALLENTGVISAEGGYIQMSAASAKQAVDSIINIDGVVTAASASKVGGKIVLSGGSAGTVTVAGKVDASGSTGGRIDVTGQNIEIASTAELNANANTNGDGGRIYIIGGNSAILQGSVSARGGAQSGNGGFVELSSDGLYGIGGAVVDTTAVNGKTGTFLIDPRDLELRIGTRSGLDVWNLYESDIELLSWATDIELNARRNFSVSEQVYGNSDGIITINNGNSLNIWTQNSAYTYTIPRFFRPDLVVTEAVNSGSIDLTGNQTYGANLLWKTNGNGDITVTGATAGDQASNIILSALETQSGDINITTQNGAIDFLGNVTTQGGNITAEATDQNSITANIDSNGGNVALTGGGQNFWDTGVYIRVGSEISSHNGDVNLTGQNTKVAINGKVYAGNGNIQADGDRIEFYGHGTLQGENVNLQSNRNISQNAQSKIIASTLSGSTNFSALLIGQNEVKAIADFNTGSINDNGGFTLVDVDGFDIAGTVSTLGGDVLLKTESTAFNQSIDVLASGSIVSGGGNITLDSNGTAGGFTTVAGLVDASTGGVTVSARQLKLNGLSNVNANQLDISAGLVTQGVNSIITANILTGTTNAGAFFDGVNNDIATLGNFTTGAATYSNGQFRLVDNNGLNINGAISTSGTDKNLAHGDGSINIDSKGTTWAHALDVSSASSIQTNGGTVTLASHSGGLIVKGDIDASAGNIDLSGSQVQLKYSSIVNGGLVNFDTKRVYQDTSSTLFAEGISGTSQADVVLQGANNDVGTIYDFVTGAGNWSNGGFTLVDNNGVNVAGALSTTGGDISLTEKSGALNFLSTSSVSTNGGALSVTSPALIDVDFGANINLADGNGHFDAPQVNLGADIKTTGDLDGTATLVNVENDSAQIQDGVDIAASGIVNVGAGIFSENVVINKALSVIGTGTDIATTLLGTGTGTGIQIKADDISLSGMNIDNYTYAIEVKGDADNIAMDDIAAKNSTVGLKIESISNVDGLTVANSHFDGNVEGWHFAQSKNAPSIVTNVTVTDTTFNDNAKKGIYVEKLDNASFTNVSVINSGTTGGSAAAGIDINLKYGVYQNIAIDSTKIRNSGTTASGNAITVKARNDGSSYSGNPATLTGLTITDSDIVTTGGYGIAVGNNVNDATLSINEVDGATAAGINVYGGVQDVTLDRNTIKNSQIGIAVNDSDQVQIIDNKITNITNDGIQIVNGDDVLITTNTVYGTNGRGGSNGTKGAGRDGINVNGTTNLTIDNNTIKGGNAGFLTNGGNGANRYAINVNNSAAAQITNNQLLSGRIGLGISGKSAGSDGIHVTSSNGANIDTNTIQNIGGNGIYLNPSHNAIIQNNAISNAALNGINVLSSHNVDVLNNTLWSIGNHGIYASSSNTLDVAGNIIGNGISSGAGNDGIHISGGRNANIDDNTIQGGLVWANGAGNDGIHVVNNREAVINNNTIIGGLPNSTGAGRHGIYAENSGAQASIFSGWRRDGVEITNNTITNGLFSKSTGQDGIHIVNSGSGFFGSSANIAGNTINWVGHNGISVDSSFNTDILNNNVKHADNDGISLYNTSAARIELNTVKGVARDGIHGEDNGAVSVKENVVSHAQNNGIDLMNTAWVSVRDNNISLIGNNGIDIEGARIANVSLNNVSDTDNDGISVSDVSVAFTAEGNTVSFNGGDGIDVDHVRAGKILNNIVASSGDNGIEVSQSDSVLIQSNNVTKAKGTGIHVKRSDDAVIGGAGILSNTINKSGNGITVRGSDNVTVENNAVTNSKRTAIFAKNLTNSAIINNIVDGVKRLSGISIEDGTAINVSGNTIDNTKLDGISAVDVGVLTIDANLIGTTGTIGANGIYLEAFDDAIVTGNTVIGAGDDGIFADGYNDNGHGQTLLIGNNSFSDLGGNGITANYVDSLEISGNTITNAQDDGISTYLYGVGSGLIQDNAISVIGSNGIHATGFNSLSIIDNTITAVNEYGILIGEGRFKEGDFPDFDDIPNIGDDFNEGGAIAFLDIFSQGDSRNIGSVILEGNTVTDAKVGARFEQGNIDISSLTNPNTFINTAFATPVGLQFDGAPSDLTIVGQTIGATVFEGFLNADSFYTRFEFGSIIDPVSGDPLVINGLGANFDGFTPPASGILTQAQLDFLEDRIYDADDAPINSSGQLFTGFVPVENSIENIEDFFNTFGAFAGANGNLQVTISSLPFIQQPTGGIQGFSAAGLNNLTPAAGGDETAESLSNIEPAAGDEGSAEEVSCWGDAVSNASGGKVSSFSFGGSFDGQSLAQASGCSTASAL